jgi:cytochrome c
MTISKAGLGFIALGAATLAALSAAGAAQAAGPAAGNPANGKTVFARCAACHDLNTGAVRMGPSLKGVMGRKAGTAANFGYSGAMKNKGVVWAPDTLDAFLAAPMKYVSGTRMAFAGISNAQERADVIAYLKQAAK